MEIEDIHIERAHRVGNTDNTLRSAINAKFSSFKEKQKVLPVAKKLKGKDTCVKEKYLKRLQIFGKRNGKH